jgi:hypothetical protein
MCVWHALAKLRLHTQRTQHALKIATRNLGQTLQLFRRDVSKRYGALPELPAEAAARFCRESKAKAQGKAIKKRRHIVKGAKVRNLNKVLNLCTSKLHALGDYASMVFQLGPSDSCSTQLVCDFSFSLLVD